MLGGESAPADDGAVQRGLGMEHRHSAPQGHEWQSEQQSERCGVGQGGGSLLRSAELLCMLKAAVVRVVHQHAVVQSAKLQGVVDQALQQLRLRQEGQPSM